MSEKGGKQSKETESLISFKMVATAIVGVLLGAVIVLSLIFTGVIVGDRYRDSRAKRAYEDKVVDVVGISYDKKEYSYRPVITDDDEIESCFRTLIDTLGAKEGEDYIMISSQSEFDKVISAINTLGGEVTKEDFDLSENFFYSGSVILVTAEMRGLSSFEVNSVTRDENYNLRVDVSKADADETQTVFGKAVLITVPNIQPEDVEVVQRAE